MDLVHVQKRKKAFSAIRKNIEVLCLGYTSLPGSSSFLTSETFISGRIFFCEVVFQICKKFYREKEKVKGGDVFTVVLSFVVTFNSIH